VIATLAAILALAGSSAGALGTDDPIRELGDRQLAGQRIVTGFSGQEPPDTLVRMIQEGRVAGVILFSQNFDSEAEARALTTEFRRIRQPRGLRQPLLIAVDQEGGLVKRLPGPPSMSAAQMGGAGRQAAARQGAKTGSYLDRLGFNLDFAPVLDLAVPGGEIARTARSSSASPNGVIDTALAFGRAMSRHGVAATAKHFPGFGRATENTDAASQTITASRTELRDQDERPFEAWADDRLEMVMLANAIYPALDQGRPASLSRAVASHELRRVVGFEGVSVTDSLDAAGITAVGSPERVATLGARAGADLLLFTSLASAYRAGQSLATGLRHGHFDRKRFRSSVERTLALRDSLRG
jgi:beta-N-acetylhexosaminidase